jgi:hypothetical protein
MALVLAGCRDAGPAQSPAPPSPPPGLGEVRKQLLIDASAMEATALNEGSALEVLGKLERTARSLGVGLRIPDAPDVAGLEAQVASHATARGLTAMAFEATARPVSPRQIPERIQGDRRHAFEDGDLLGTLDVRFRLEPLDIGRLDPWLRTLPSGMERMLEVTSVQADGTGFAVEAVAWWFLEPRWPVHEPTDRPLGAYLEDAGVSESPAALAAAFPRQWQEIQALYARLRAARPGAEETLTLLSKAACFEARWDFFEGAAKRIERVTVADVLQ